MADQLRGGGACITQLLEQCLLSIHKALCSIHSSKIKAKQKKIGDDTAVSLYTATVYIKWTTQKKKYH